MRYRDLVQFDPIETVVQLRDADRADAAKRLVQTYVVSDDMAERLAHVVVPNLRFDRPGDHKGLLIVGNYGTGKSHLMSLISAIAEHQDLTTELRGDGLAETLQPIAGRFCVVRTELGSTTMDLRDFVCTQLEEALAVWDVEYQFPPRDRLPNHKRAFEDLMALFLERHPDRGILFVVDELLDYLRGRDDHAIILDLGFLREIGEVCRDLRFRFIAGVQELLFDSGRFAHVSDSLRRVRDRYDQVTIARRDVKHVVAERLLRKTAEQHAAARAYLAPFAPAFDQMNERLDEFARLFPIHPDYVDTFERISAIEKREVLRTVSTTVGSLLDQEIPHDRPGVVAYDSYWRTILENPSFRADPNIKPVIDVSQVLAARIEQAFTRPAYRPTALKIVNALSVHRLTTGDIDAKIGPTPEELRDTLCLYEPSVAELGGDPAADLLTYVETVLREIHRTVNGQFISINPDNRQVYLDLRKTADYDALIDQRAESLSPEEVDRAYFLALQQVIVEQQEAIVSGFKIWEHELEWTERKAARRGYLFFGAPNERSTAQPPRDFYLYFLQLLRPPQYRDEQRADEVFFKLARPDAKVRKSLDRYAAAILQAQVASTQAKRVYESKAEDELTDIVDWLREQMATAVDVTYQGRTRPLIEWLTNGARGRRGAATSGARANIRDLVNAVGSVCLEQHFADQAPEYPTFGVLVTGQNRPLAAQDAVRSLRGSTRTQQATAVLDALELLDGERIAPARSRYGRAVMDALQARPAGQVLNRADLVQDILGVEYAWPERFRLEPEWLAVVLAALVYSGDAVLAIPGQTFDATRLDALAQTPIDQLTAFRHVERPREWNLPALIALFELLGLSSGSARAVAQGSADAVEELQGAVGRMVERAVVARQSVESGLPFWGRSILGDAERAQSGGQLDGLKAFVEGLQVYTTPGRLKNLRVSVEDVEAQRPAVQALQTVERLGRIATALGPLASYLSQAELVLPDDQPWVLGARQARSELWSRLDDPAQREAETFSYQEGQRLEALRRAYQDAYVALHSRARLNQQGDSRKGALMRDPRQRRLRLLASIDLLSTGRLTDLQNRLAGLKSCLALTLNDLQSAPVCPHCDFRPQIEPAALATSAVLDDLDAAFDRLLDEWTEVLLDNLEDPTIRESLELLDPAAQSRVEAFLTARRLPDVLDEALVEALREVLAGLIRIVLDPMRLRDALVNGGAPATPEVVRRRFESYLATLTRDADPSRVRIVLE